MSHPAGTHTSPEETPKPAAPARKPRAARTAVKDGAAVKPTTAASTAEPAADTTSATNALRAAGLSWSTLRRYRTSVAILIALVAGLIIWLVARDNGGASKSAAAAVSAQQLATLAASVHHPVFWLGTKANTTYELVRSSNGAIYIRYLPPGVAVGAAGEYLTVATYPFPGAYAAIQAVSQQPGITPIKLQNGGAAETSVSDSTNVHAAYPGVDYQAEVFDPRAGAAARFVRRGRLIALGKLNATVVPTPTPTSPAQLRAVAASLGHPIYWVGAKAGYSYELAKTSDGQVQISYVPAGQASGASGSYLTIGTYPFPKPLAAIRQLGKQPGAQTIKLKGGGLAVIDQKTPQSIHLAYPNSDYQLEVYDPSAATAKRVVSSGELKSIG